jgi:hypothetical protein
VVVTSGFEPALAAVAQPGSGAGFAHNGFAKIRAASGDDFQNRSQ